MAKSKKKNMTKYYLWIGSLLVFAIILLIIYFADSNEMNRAMKTEGYTTEEQDDPFYKKITTGNTLDDYYNDLANNRDSNYEEYYLQKGSYNFLEQKLSYQNEVTSALNITSDLRNLNTDFTYELSYKEAHLIIEGNNNNNYQCKVIINKNTTEETIENACNRVHEELDTFFVRRNEILSNEKVQAIIDSAPDSVERNNIID